jgi:hypothetical protein
MSHSNTPPAKLAQNLPARHIRAVEPRIYQQIQLKSQQHRQNPIEDPGSSEQDKKMINKSHCIGNYSPLGDINLIALIDNLIITDHDDSARPQGVFGQEGLRWIEFQLQKHFAREKCSLGQQICSGP